MTLYESTIYIKLLSLRKTLYKCQFVMDKTNRIVYGTPMMQSLREAMGYYVMAFEVTDLEEKGKFMSLCIGAFANVRMDLDFMKDENMFHFRKHRRKSFEFPKATDCDGNVIPEYTSQEQREDDLKYELNQWINIFELIANLDKEIRRYSKSVRKRAKGKSVVGTNFEATSD